MNAPSESGSRAGVARSIEDLLAHEGPEFIRQAYRTLLGREADPGGFVAYLNRLSDGLDRQQVIAELSQSDEGRRFAARVPGVTREPERAASPRSIEDLLGLSGADFVKAAYDLLLGRAADPSGLTHYVTRLQDGASRTQVLVDIASSEEFAQRARVVPGVDKLLAEHRRHPLLIAASRLIRPLRGRAAGMARAAPAVPAASPAALPSPGQLRPAVESRQGLARPANPARARLMTLPALEERLPRDAA